MIEDLFSWDITIAAGESVSIWYGSPLTIGTAFEPQAAPIYAGRGALLSIVGSPPPSPSEALELRGASWGLNGAGLSVVDGPIISSTVPIRIGSPMVLRYTNTVGGSITVRVTAAVTR